MAKSRKKTRIYWLTFAGVLLIILLILGIHSYKTAFKTFDGPRKVTIVIPENSTKEAIRDSLAKNLGDFGEAVYKIWDIRGGNPDNASGSYIVSPGDKAWSIAKRIKNGQPSHIANVTFNNIRLLSDLSEKIAGYFPWKGKEFLEACDSILPAYGFKKEEYVAAFIPDTYQFYESATPEEVVNKLVKHRNNFWSNERRAKADSLGITPVEVATIASIVEEESHNKEEQPTIARLYMNRLKKGMRLQADPTVKFALGDFTIKRLREKHTKVESPYNTYFVDKLPPGPIRIPDASTLDAVLNCPENDYIYMCAKPDNSGTHNFTSNYTEHKKNATEYRKWLDSINIK